MSLLDNGKMKYAWNDEWVNPYESAWNIGEKIYASNISARIYNELMGVTTSGIKINYNSNCLLYSKGIIKSAFIPRFMQDGTSFFKAFKGNSYYFSTKLRYCPECAKHGYHSIFHQLIYLDRCIIHNDTLLNLCDCNDSGIISGKRKLHIPFSCKNCGAHMPYPEVADGIINKWHNTNQFKILPSVEVKNIYTVDVFIGEITIQRERLTSKQLEVLQNITMGKSLNEFPTPELVEDIDSINTPLLFLANEIQDHIIEKYGKEYCEEQFYLLRRYRSASAYEYFDFTIIAAFYLMGELLCESNLDRIYPVNFNVLPFEFDNYYTGLLEGIQRYFLRDKNCHIPQCYLDRIKYKTYKVVNRIYKAYATERYHEIKRALINSSPMNYPLNSNYIPFEADSNYSIYLILETNAGKLYLY